MPAHIRKKNLSLRMVILFVVAAVAIPLLFTIIIFNWFVYKGERSTKYNTYQNTLTFYASSIEQSAIAAQNFIISKSVNDTDYQSVLYARDKTNAFLHSQIVSEKGRVLVNGEGILNTFLIYSEPFDLWHISQEVSYSKKDLQIIQDYIQQNVTSHYTESGWVPLSLSDHIVFIFYVSNKNTVMSAIIDLNTREYSGLTDKDHIFFSLSDGTILTNSPISDFVIQDSDFYSIHTSVNETWNFTKYHLEQPDCYVIYAYPYSFFTEHFTLTQQIIFTATIILIVAFLLYWLLLRELLMKPLNRLTYTTKAIEAGSLDIRVSENARIEEVNWIAQSVNTMMDTIRQQKVDAYEHQLEIQQAQLQYLQAQIHPHFYLNCLNLIYSLAEEKKYSALQNLTLDLSAYLRSMFRDTFHLTSLGSELHSAECYIRIQAAGQVTPPQLNLFVSDEIKDYPIPPLSILTFVENSIKHGFPSSPPLIIRIKAVYIESEEGNYLNITITDNGGGYPESILHPETSEQDTLYRDQHIGIQNIRKRLQLLYNDQAALVLRNVSNGACADLFIPINKEESDGVML